MPSKAIVVFNRYQTGDTIFFVANQEPVVIEAPEGYGNESRAARLQGALLGLMLKRNSSPYLPVEPDEWKRICKETIDMAYQGTNVRPWLYPNKSDH